ncbi:hypothetical protein BDQ17DRAFT_551655 [Cyathus striatus]|nr:hypothetical protein BDQ17DRAFT_551655 [Cyathus striatus]
MQSPSEKPPETDGRKPTNAKSRRVQWLDDHSGGKSPQSPTHLLDEYGLDLHAFERLTHALERHRRAAPLGQIHYYPPQSPASPSSQEDEDESPSLEALLGTETPYASSSAASSASSVEGHVLLSTHDVPYNYIDPHEKAGLPGTRDLRTFARNKAAKLVQAHARLRNRREGARSGRRISDTGTHGGFASREDGNRDVERHAGESLRGGRGLLSALLDLYEQPGTPTSGYTSGYTSILSSGSATPNLNTSGASDSLREKRKEKQKPHSPKPHIPLPGRISRPVQAKTSGGVIGALIASTGNLSGWGAPAPSTLQPDLKRPGYRLTRYTLDQVPTLNEPRPATLRRASDPATATLFPNEAEATPVTPPPSPTLTPIFYPTNWPEMIKDLPGSFCKSWIPIPSPTLGIMNEKPREGSDRKRKLKKRKRIKSEIYITQHVAKIIQREEFLLKLTRAMMMFGGPPHRLPAQLQSAARVLDIELNIFYLPDIALLSFDDSSTGTSHIKMIRQGSSLDLGKLDDAYQLYWKVIHDKLSVSDASIQLDDLMRKKPMYNWWQSMFMGGMCSTAICTVSFSGSFIDALICFPLGALLVAIQILSARNVLYSYVFEVTITTLFSFIAAALAATHRFCYSAIASSSVVLILPGFLVLTGSLELMSRHIVSGSVRICYAVVYALFLGFGFTIGAQMYELFTVSKVYGAENYDCSMTHDPFGGWYQRTPSKMWAFLTVPMFSTFLSMKNQAPYNRKELFMLIGIACIGWVTNYFAGTRFVNQSDITAAVGAFAVGLVSNLCSRFFSGNAFVIMITGILFQLPSGLGTGGLLSYASEQTGGSPDSYISGFRTALKLVSVAIGLAIGLALSLSLTHPIQSKRREAGIFSL